MSICPHTGLSVPECSCSSCLERQIQEFAPGATLARRSPDPARAPLVSQDGDPRSVTEQHGRLGS